MRTLAALGAAVLLAVAGCTASSHDAAGATPTRSSAVRTSGSALGAHQPAGDITLAFAGDVHFMGRTLTLLNNPSSAFGPIQSVLSAADVTTVNLETSVTDRGSPEPKTFHFRAPTTAFDAIRAAGIDAVTIANNHILDYGRVGLADTIANARAASFPVFGAGANADAAWKPWITTVRGVKIAYIGISDVQELASSWIATPTRAGEAIANDLTRSLAAVKAAKSQADIVVVFMHWGTEEDSCPNSMQKTLAKQLSQAGADIIVGAHSHVLQGSGWLGKTFVAYGMGNFLWWRDVNGPQTGVLKLTIPGGKVASLTADFTPALISSTGQPQVATGSDATKILQRYASLRSCTGLSAKPSP